MDLVITTYGAYLHRRGELFAVKAEGATREVAARRVRSIVIATAASLSTDAVQLALEKNIDIVFVNRFGDPFGRVWHGRPGSTTTIRRTQLRVADTHTGFEMAREWMLEKVQNQVTFLEAARKRRPRLSARLTPDIQALRQVAERLRAIEGILDDVRGTVMGIEGKAARVYWRAINTMLPVKYRFAFRSRNPAKDPFNCLLNYAYGVLYGTVERACMLAGLDPYVGFIHTDHYCKPSLVFDLIERYRVWADETVLGLFASRKVKDSMFDNLTNGLTLNKEGKAVLMTRFGEYLDHAVRHRGRNVKRREVVQLDCHRIAAELIELSRGYEGDLPVATNGMDIEEEEEEGVE